MENIQEKIPIIIAGLVAVAICIIAYLFLENYEAVYYTKIDNTKVNSISSTDDMKYEYSLISYNKNGKEKEIKFKTSRILRDNAYLILEVRTMGVHSWKELDYMELPEKVRINYIEN